MDSLFLEILSAGKYRGCRSVLNRLARGAAERLGVEVREAALIPVPLSPCRKRERGFNQSEIFARFLVERWGGRVETDWVRRRGGGAALAGLPRAERAQAITGKFQAIVRRFPGENAPPLVLVDDVFTTGSTLGDCERAMVEAGGRVLARVVLGRAFGSREDRA